MPASVNRFSIAQSVSPVESTSSMVTTRASLESKSRCISILFSLDLSGVRISIVIDEIYDERLITDTVGGGSLLHALMSKVTPLGRPKAKHR